MAISTNPIDVPALSHNLLPSFSLTHTEIKFINFDGIMIRYTSSNIYQTNAPFHTRGPRLVSQNPFFPTPRHQKHPQRRSTGFSQQQGILPNLHTSNATQTLPQTSVRPSPGSTTYSSTSSCTTFSRSVFRCRLDALFCAVNHLSNAEAVLYIQNQSHPTGHSVTRPTSHQA